MKQVYKPFIMDAMSNKTTQNIKTKLIRIRMLKLKNEQIMLKKETHRAKVWKIYRFKAKWKAKM